MDGATLYILRCADGKLYTGLTRRDVDERVSEHRQGLSAFTTKRLPVELIFSEHYEQITDAIDAERRIKGWTRAKKLAYVAGDFEFLSELARRRGRGQRYLVVRDALRATHRKGASRRAVTRAAAVLASGEEIAVGGRLATTKVRTRRVDR